MSVAYPDPDPRTVSLYRRSLVDNLYDQMKEREDDYDC